MTSGSLRRIMGLWGALAAVLVVLTMMAMATPYEPDNLGPGHDARAYWGTPIDDPYSPAAYGSSDDTYCWTESTWVSNCYRYSPAFLLAFTPLQAVGWQLFVGLWAALMMGVLFWMVRSLLFLPALLISLPEIWGGNITLLIAAAVVIGFTQPWAWALPLLTKVTPGVGLLWFVVRREWFKLSVAITATIAIIAAVAAFTPGLWEQWYSTLVGGTSSGTVPPGAVPIPFLPRLPFAVGIIVFAAWRDQKWLLPIGVLLAMPVIWPGYVALLTGSIALKRDEAEKRYEGWLMQLYGYYDRRIAPRFAATSG